CAFSIAVSIALDAFGAHGLKNILSEQKLDVFHKANRYLMLQSMGAILILLLKSTNKFTIIPQSVTTLLRGTWIFSIALYAVTFSEFNGLSFLRYAGAVAPAGGVLMIFGWILLGKGLLSPLNNENTDSAQAR
ncbi:MAG: DUF423 domain-containing protein, partial [Chitinophagaceae bacterium]